MATLDRAARVTIRFVVTGPECTGKTTLAARLAEDFSAPWVAEASRQHAEKQLGDGRALDVSDVEPIARAHMAAEDGVLTAEPAIVVLDTDLISTVAYARHYYGISPAWIEAEARARLADLYLLCSPDIPWVADGVRDRPTQRDELFRHFSSVLSEFGAPVQVVRGRDPERTADAIAAARRVARVS